MDYDDNDFQSQNFHLASEDSNKNPSSLRAFGLPKYDFDEHLHVHLRFDSLVDTEPLLGINGQSSNWIDDFSARNSAIEFSSGAAESCSISWHNNVWSEATSSESVEMLLKSVGEDEILDQQTTIEEANAIEGFNCTDNQIGMFMGGDSPYAESSETVAKGSVLPSDISQNTCSAITVEEMEDQHQDVVEGCSGLEHNGSKLGESFLPQKMNSESTMVQCRIGKTSYNVTETFDEVPFDSDKQLVDGFMKSNLESTENFTERVAMEVHGSQSLHFEVCPSDVSFNDNNNDGTKLSAKVFSEHVVEEQSAIGFSADAVLLPEEAEKQEAHSKHGEGIYQFSEGYDVHHDHQHKENSTELEVNEDLSAPEVGSRNSFSPNNVEKMLESVHPHQNHVESLTQADEFAEQIHPGCSSIVALNRGDDDARKLPHLEAHITNTDNSQTVDTQLNETIDVGDGHGEQRASHMSAEETSETQGPGFQLADNAAGYQSSTEIALERPIVKEHDGFVFSQPVSQNLEANYSEKCTKDEVGKKAEPTPYMPKDDSCHVSTFLPEDSDVGNGNVNTSGLDDVHDFCDPSFTGVNVVDYMCKDELVKKTAEEGDWSSRKASQEKAEEQHTGVSSPIQGIVTDGKQNRGEGIGNSEISHNPSLANTEDAQHIRELATQSNSAYKDGSSSDALIHVDNRNERTEGAFCGDSKTSYGCSDDAVVVHTTMEQEPTCTGDAAESFLNKSQQSCSNSESETTLGHHGGGVGSNQGPSQPACGMMTVTGSSEYPKEEKGLVLETILNATDGGKGHSVLHNSKHGASFQNGKSFAVPVESSLNISTKVVGDEMRPPLNIQAVDFSQKQNEESTTVKLKHEEGKRPETNSKKKDEKNISASSTEKVKSSRRRSSKEPSLRKQTPDKKNNVGIKLPILLGPVDKDLQIKHAYESNSRASCSPAVQNSGLPDLNSSVSPSALLHQPFTDFQQLQLRAQIFVYGSLIQGTPPDEACMISAFGGTEECRNMWNAIWRTAVERFQNQKSPLSSSESHILSRSGIRIAEQVTGCSTIQSKALSPPVSWNVSKVVSTVPLPSPLWSISNRDGLHPNISTGSQLDLSQPVSPVYSCQATQTNEHMGIGVARPLPANLGSPVFPSQISKIDAAAYFSKFSLAETVRASPGRDTSTLSSSSMQIQPASALLSSSAPAVEAENKAGSAGIIKNQSNTPKSRKRKKAAVPEGSKLLLATSSQAQVHPGSVTGVLKSPSAAPNVAFEVNTPVKSVIPGPSPAAIRNVSSSQNQNQIISGVGQEQRAVLSVETCSRVEQAKLQAEDAAAHAASAVRHSQGIWSHLATQKNSGLVLEVEEKLASAAVAAAAAASVAKAAAAAAKVASDAALQAKMMADEALSLVEARRMSNNSDPSLVDFEKSIASLTPVSILKGKDKTSGSNVALSAAKEVARKRVEAASTAAKRAENMDAIVKAAELAAEAVAQAGTIIAMGDPLPLTLNDLAEAGPEGYWRARPTAEQLSDRPRQLDMKEAGVVGQVDHEDSLNLRVEHEIRIDDLLYQQSAGTEKAYASQNDLSENIIEKGAAVEVVSDEDGLRGVWFSAHVLDVKDGKAYVCFDNLLRDEGAGQLKEWIPLEEEGDKPPRIRIAHPMTQAGSGATRKRRREALSNYTWAVGDRVDALIRDGWWEGIIMEKNKEDGTKLTVHFPAGGDSAAVRAWNLRPSLFWKDGQWREWMRPRENSFHEGDTPQEKRQRVTRSAVNGGSETDVVRDGKQLKTIHNEVSRRPEESDTLPLSAKERIFTMGNKGSQANTFDARKMKRSGLQEGPRVVFGVPKPGKKRKFMAVSEHYVADKADKASEGNNALKFAKYLMPQAPRSWRTTSKATTNSRVADNSSLRLPKSVQSQSIRNRNLSGKASSVIIASDGEVGEGPTSNTFSSNEENIQAHNNLEAGSENSYGATDNAIVQSSGPPAPIGPSKKIYTSLAEEAGLKGKRSNIFGKSTKIEKTSEYSAGTIPDTEPRRSNRRIQPTSRLLEGLQSSLLIPKMPSVAHDKGSKALHKGKSSVRGRVHG